MLLTLDPRLPVVWRSPTALQVGVDDVRVVLEDVDVAGERVLAALETGASPEGAAALALARGGDPATVERVLAALTPALVPVTPPASPRVAVDGTGPLADGIRRLLSAADALDEAGGASDEHPVLTVVVAGWVVDPARSGWFVRRDAPHLPVVAGERLIRIGPLVVPGAGPCLRCLELARARRDAAWPAIAAQLAGRVPTLVDPAAISAAAGLAVGAALAAARETEGTARHASPDDDDAAAELLELDAVTGRVRSVSVRAEPECGCRALPGSATAAVSRFVRRDARPTSARDDAVPA